MIINNIDAEKTNSLYECQLLLADIDEDLKIIRIDDEFNLLLISVFSMED